MLTERNRTFGPVPSRRLGKSLGVNNLEGKTCTCSCVYCQAGRTQNLTVERRAFYEPEKLIEEVIRVFEATEPDVVSFVPSGEPTLDINLGKVASVLKDAGVPLAILTNGTLLFREDVREDLMPFDVVSLKVDVGSEELFRKVNRPHASLSLREVREGMLDFSEEYGGTLITETMLVDGVNDGISNAESVVEFLLELDPEKAYISIPIRPPAEPWVRPPPEERVLSVYELFRRKLGNRVFLLVEYEKPDFTLLGDIERELLSLTTSHPLRTDYALRILAKKGLDAEEVLQNLLKRGLLREVEYRGHKFLMPRLRAVAGEKEGG